MSGDVVGVDGESELPGDPEHEDGLVDEGLRAGDTDLLAGQDIQAELAHPLDGRIGHVDDGGDPAAPFPGVLQRVDDVHRLPALAEGDDERIPVDVGVVPELGRDQRLALDARPVKIIGAQERGVVGRPAGGEDDLFRAPDQPDEARRTPSFWSFSIENSIRSTAAGSSRISLSM